MKGNDNMKIMGIEAVKNPNIIKIGELIEKINGIKVPENTTENTEFLSNKYDFGFDSLNMFLISSKAVYNIPIMASEIMAKKPK
jgi:hypothetical protein